MRGGSLLPRLTRLRSPLPVLCSGWPQSRLRPGHFAQCSYYLHSSFAIFDPSVSVLIPAYFAPSVVPVHHLCAVLAQTIAALDPPLVGVESRKVLKVVFIFEVIQYRKTLCGTLRYWFSLCR